MHVKDVAPAGEALDEKGFADLCHGTLDRQALWDASVEAGSQLMIVEHDLPSDRTRFARRSIERCSASGPTADGCRRIRIRLRSSRIPAGSRLRGG